MLALRAELLLMRYHRTPPRLPDIDGHAPRSYLLTLCIKDRRRIFGNDIAARIACHEIFRYRDQGQYHLYAYCVMPDHVHLALRIGSKRNHISRIVAMLKAAIFQRLKPLELDFAWQRGFHDRLIRDGEDSAEVVRYVLANPRRANLVRGDEPYEFAGVVDLWF